MLMLVHECQCMLMDVNGQCLHWHVGVETNTAGTTGQGAWQPLPTWDICAHAEPVLSARHSCVSRAVAAPGSATGSQSWFVLNWRMPQVMIRYGRFGCWKRGLRFWTIGCWGCNFRENTSCQRRLSGTRLLRVWVWLGLGGTFLQSKSCVCWSFLSSGNAFFAKHHI